MLSAFLSPGSITQSMQAVTNSVTGLTESESDGDSHDDSDLPPDSNPDSELESENTESEHIQHTLLPMMSEGPLNPKSLLFIHYNS